MPHQSRRTLCLIPGTVLLLIMVIATGVVAGNETKKQSVNFRDIRRDGTTSIIGRLGIAIGQIVTIEGTLAKPSKVSNSQTLRFSAVNGKPIGKRSSRKWAPLIQVRNVDSLPKEENIVVEGYEFLSWSGNSYNNWKVEVEFMITKVISPTSLILNNRGPYCPSITLHAQDSPPIESKKTKTKDDLRKELWKGFREAQLEKFNKLQEIDLYEENDSLTEICFICDKGLFFYYHGDPAKNVKGHIERLLHQKAIIYDLINRITYKKNENSSSGSFKLWYNSRVELSIGSN